MLQFFYKLTRKKGAVLFAVIAIMSLLICMASAAYLTARGSYKTVLSNYDFSQMYLSATSVSDMMIAAVAQDTSVPSVNKFADLKQQIKDLKSKAPGSAAAKLVGTSNNIAGKSTQAAILDAAAAHPVEDGVLDAVRVEISLDKKETDKPSTGLDTYYFTFNTTAYYRDNMVTISDTIYNVCGVEESLPIMPNTFFTATGQILNPDAKKGTRAVCIDTKDISDNAYFENNYTVFCKFEGNENKFHGGVTTSGGLYMLGNFTTDIPAPNATTKERHDWIIGGDLVICAENTNLNLNGNNLYVAGDLIVGNQQTISAANIYVLGNIIFTNGNSTKFNGNLKDGTTKNCNVYCGGNIIGKGASSAALSGKWSGAAGWTTAQAEINAIRNQATTAGTKAGKAPSFWNQTEGYFNNGWSINGTFYQTTGGTQTGFGHNVSVAGGFDPAAVAVKISSKVEDGHSFKWEEKDTNVADVLDPDKGPVGTNTYSNYSAETATYNNKLTIDLNGTITSILPKQGGKKEGQDWYQKTFSATNGETATVEYVNGKSLTIDLPWSDSGYLLDIRTGSGNTTGSEKNLRSTVDNNIPMTINIHVKDGKTMPIVLAPNFYDANSGTGVDADGHNAFGWLGSVVNGNPGGNCIVQLVNEAGSATAQGNVVFEMANIAKASVTIDGTNYNAKDLCPYDATKAASLESAVYFASCKEFVGTKAQYDLAKTKNATPAEISDWSFMLDGNVPKSGYENRIMLISNKNNDKAVDAFRFLNTFCGYVYAPNGSYYCSGNGKMPVFGGLIVSDYIAVHAYFVYAEPDPTIIKDLLDAVHSDGTGDPTPEEGIWYMSGTGIGKNYLG